MNNNIFSKFNKLSQLVKSGEKILSKITNIDACLNQMSELKEFRICSINNCYWHADISSEEIKAFVTKTLLDKKVNLTEDFNNLMTQLQSDD